MIQCLTRTGLCNEYCHCKPTLKHGHHNKLQHLTEYKFKMGKYIFLQHCSFDICVICIEARGNTSLATLALSSHDLYGISSIAAHSQLLSPVHRTLRITTLCSSTNQIRRLQTAVLWNILDCCRDYVFVGQNQETRTFLHFWGLIYNVCMHTDLILECVRA